MLDDIIERKPARVRFGNEMIREFAQMSFAIATAERRFFGSLADESADASTRFQNPHPLQLGINFGNRVRVDAQIHRQLPHGR